jgi:hypothetical protein
MNRPSPPDVPAQTLTAELRPRCSHEMFGRERPFAFVEGEKFDLAPVIEGHDHARHPVVTSQSMATG